MVVLVVVTVDKEAGGDEVEIRDVTYELFVFPLSTSNGVMPTRRGCTRVDDDHDDRRSFLSLPLSLSLKGVNKRQTTNGVRFGLGLECGICDVEVQVTPVTPVTRTPL